MTDAWSLVIQLQPTPYDETVMLEILVLFSMCRFLHKKATEKGWPGWPFVLAMIFSWVGFGFSGAVVGVIVTGDDGELPVGGIIGYLVGAVMACITNAVFVNLLPDRNDQPDDDDYRPRPRSQRERFDDGDEDSLEHRARN